jgi:RimJ/RimL family protein N-acetyltransferase
VKRRSIETERLLLRPWRDSDLGPFAELNTDVRVMEFFLSTLPRSESDAFAMKVRAHFDEHGYGLWAVEVKEGAPFIGFVGLATVTFEAPFVPAVEIGWRLAHASWGRGYASEAARASLRLAFEELALDEVVSFTVETNQRSRAVMERIGMHHVSAGDFDHPRIPESHPLCRHALYRLGRAEWASGELAREATPNSRPRDPRSSR